MSEITKKQKVEQEVVVGTKCDICGKKSDEAEPDGWHETYHGHEDWGGDSIDSMEYFDVCSPKCYIKLLNKSVKELGRRRTGYIGDMSIHFAVRLLEHFKART